MGLAHKLSMAALEGAAEAFFRCSKAAQKPPPPDLLHPLGASASFFIPQFMCKAT